MSRTRHKVADEEELATDGDRVVAEVNGKEIAVFLVGGEYYAALNHCVHQGGPLCEGELTDEMVVGDDDWEWLYDGEKKIVTCPWHGWKFDVTTGENTQDNRYVVPQYEVVVTDGDVYVVVLTRYWQFCARALSGWLRSPTALFSPHRCDRRTAQDSSGDRSDHGTNNDQDVAASRTVLPVGKELIKSSARDRCG